MKARRCSVTEVPKDSYYSAAILNQIQGLFGGVGFGPPRSHLNTGNLSDTHP